ncbi:gliding motility-associated peptidyl-prolyl isomerase GldI [Lutibacter sp.]|uniref:gliding motility-associated peptidyl-prolyl isomerase GldI n=1 Tax=Lutibacter sp. TaxID=1925666 RepID=UPI002734F468|nr:gliding motility-associated peptidyl-prolyl isomerase GldI [Lutibacter sp.]MDP3311801.1 gliding motility-associated peptidyl-prolyl isomerase GldI [Lutibacter sp.]
MVNKLLYFFIAFIFFSCINPVPRNPIVRKSSSFMEESVMFNKKLNGEEELLFKNYMKLDSNEHYLNSSKGFWYSFNAKSNQNYVPQKGDECIFTYEVLNIENEIIYSRDEIGEKSYFIDQQEIKDGLRNALKIMGEGDMATFLFPSHLMYGYTGDTNKIGINQPLIYKVQLIKINKKNENK